jgi:3-oxoacyl-[acyl-carrier-protein] synthase II
VSFVPLITGAGLTTALGKTRDATWHALLAGRFISTHSRIGDLEDDGAPRIHLLARRVASEALETARWSENQRRDAAIIVGTSKGPAESWLASSASTAPPDLRLGLADTATFLARTLAFTDGPRFTLSAACASGLHALIRAAMLIRMGETQRVLVVAAESSLHPLFVQSFRRLGVLAPEDVGCRPFDENRAGFLMSEAAAAICLEAVDSDHLSKFPGSIAVERYAMAGDATHLTGSNPEGRTLRCLLAHVLNNRSVDLVHAHGTGTVANDATELAAIEAELPESADGPFLHSHKGALGHSLGAAGLVAVVVNYLAHRSQCIPPNTKTTAPLPTSRVRIRREIVETSVTRSIVLASGFGGASAAISLATRK